MKWILGVGKFPQFAELVVVDGHLPVVSLVVETVYEHTRQRQVGGQVELLPDNLVKIFVNYAKIFLQKNINLVKLTGPELFRHRRVR